MEDNIRHSTFVQQVAVIGHNQFCTAALIQLHIQHTANLTEQDIQEKIWKAVQRANQDAPSHSKILRELIYILPIDQTLPTTDKGTIMRNKVNQIYSTTINEIYFKFSNVLFDKQTNKQSIWTKESLKEFLLKEFQSIGKDIDDHSRSIFHYGLNSLELIQLTNLIRKQICQIPTNFLYEYSSFDQIIEQLFEYLHKKSLPNEDTHTFHYASTEQILDQFIGLIKANSCPAIESMSERQTERVFLLTGANGSLGNFLLRDLLQQSPSVVKHVFCFLRGPNPQERLFQSFEQRQLDLSLLTTSLADQRLIILSQSMNLTEEHLGLSDEIYHQLEGQLTDIIHTAWKMNFNQTVKDFRDDSVRGVYHLLKLCRKNQIHFHFLSSISSAGSGLIDPVKEEPLPKNPQVALPQGYGQSKYVAEHLCWTARQLWSKSNLFSLVVFKKMVVV